MTFFKSLVMKSSLIPTFSLESLDPSSTFVGIPLANPPSPSFGLPLPIVVNLDSPMSVNSHTFSIPSNLSHQPASPIPIPRMDQDQLMMVANYWTPDADGDMELYDDYYAKSPLFTCPRFPSRFSTLTDDQFDNYMNGHFLIPPSPSSIPQPDPVDDQFIS